MCGETESAQNVRGKYAKYLQVQCAAKVQLKRKFCSNCAVKSSEFTCAIWALTLGPEINAPPSLTPNHLISNHHDT